MSKNFRHLKNVIMRNHLCNTLQLQVQLLLKQQYGSGYFAAKLISNDIAKRYAISLNLSLKNVFTYYIAYWILRDMLHSQSPYTYQPLDTFVNLMILMNLVHQIWLKKFLVSACKRILLLDVQLSITKAILPNISDVLIFPIYNVYKQSHVFISFLRIFKNTLNYIFQKLSNPELNWNYSS